MADTTWRKRLEEAIKESGLSQRAIALRAGVGQSYLNGVLKHSKQPTIDKFVALAESTGKSVTWLIYGVDLSSDAEQLLKLYASLSSRQREDFLRLAQSVAGLAGQKPDELT